MRVQDHPQHAAIAAAFPSVKLDGGGMTTEQASVCFQQERLLYGQPRAKAACIHVAAVLGLGASIERMDAYDCARALMCIEAAARAFPVMGRDPRSGWDAPKLGFLGRHVFDAERVMAQLVEVALEYKRAQ